MMLRLRSAFATYPHTAALKDGRVTSDRVAFDFEEVEPITRAFRRMVRTGGFDLRERAGTPPPHAHAYKTLVDAKKPGNRQYDPECIVCHTVGFGHETGFRTAEKTPKLKDLGCEACHGPSTPHA